LQLVIKLLIILIFSVLAFGAEKSLSPQAARAIRESENLSLLKDRLPACTALIRTIKKANKEEAKILRDKLSQLSRYFYTDKGFQAYLLGKELFEKENFIDSVDNFTEAEELEKGNIDVLHYLELSQLWLKKIALADATNKKALQINPYDLDILKDELSIYIAAQDWTNALKVGESLLNENNDSSALTFFWTGLSKVKLEDMTEGVKLENQALLKDAAIPEIYFALASNNPEAASNIKLMTKYIELCTSKTLRFIERDPDSCLHLAEAQGLIAKAIIVKATPSALKKPKE
jgi:tetratricopeptide (TPR) repeat protein